MVLPLARMLQALLRGQARQVVSGLRKYMAVEALTGRRVVLVANLKPAAMRGVKSQAMVLCATSPDGTRVPAHLEGYGSLF